MLAIKKAASYPSLLYAIAIYFDIIFGSAMLANVEHYKFMAKYAKENGHKNEVDRYMLMAKIYQSLLHTK